jgi:hypothetical protein
MAKVELRVFLLATLALGLLQKPMKLKKYEELYISYNIIYVCEGIFQELLALFLTVKFRSFFRTFLAEQFYWAIRMGGRSPDRQFRANSLQGPCFWAFSRISGDFVDFGIFLQIWVPI